MLSLFLAIGVSAAGMSGAAASTAAPPVTLEQTIARILARSPARAAAVAAAEGAAAAARVSGALPNPTIEVAAENWRFGNWHWTPLPTGEPALDFFTIVSQPIELGGRRSARRTIAEADRRQADARLVQVERGLVLETARLYLSAVRAREDLTALVANQQELDTLQRAMAARVAEGMAPGADLAKFQAELVRVDIQIIRARIELRRSLARLDALSGMDTPLVPEQLVVPVVPVVPAGPPAELAVLAVDRSPDLAAARARESRAEGSLNLERSRRLPDLSVAGGYKRTDGYDTAVAGVSVSVPLFDRNAYGVAAAAGGVRVATLESADVAERVRADALAAITAARQLADQATRIDTDVLKPAEIVRQAARVAFREGATDILNLVDAERVYLEAHREALQLRLDAAAAAIEARLLLGEKIQP